MSFLSTHAMEKSIEKTHMPLLYETIHRGGLLPRDLYEELIKFITNDKKHQALNFWLSEYQKKGDFVIKELTGHRKPISCIAYDAEKNYLFSASTEKCVKVWDLKTNSCTQTLPIDCQIELHCQIACYPQCNRLLISNLFGITICNLTTGLRIKEIVPIKPPSIFPYEYFSSCFYIPERDLLLIAAKQVGIYDLKADSYTKLLPTGYSFDYPINELYYHNATDRLFLKDRANNNIKIYNLNTGFCLLTLNHNEEIISYFHDAPRDQLFTVSLNTIKIWDLTTATCKQTVRVYAKDMLGASNFTYDVTHNRLFARFANPAAPDVTIKNIGIKMWSLITGKCTDLTCKSTEYANHNSCDHLIFDTSNNSLISAENNTIKIYCFANKELEKALSNNVEKCLLLIAAYDCKRYGLDLDLNVKLYYEAFKELPMLMQEIIKEQCHIIWPENEAPHSRWHKMLENFTAKLFMS